MVSACNRDGGGTSSPDAAPPSATASADAGRPLPVSPLTAAAPTATSLGARGIPSLSYDPLPIAPVRSAAPVPVASWVWKPHQGDGFSIAFPGEPKITELPADDDRVGFTEAKLDMPGGQVSFAAGFSDHPAAAVAKPEAFLDERMSTPRRGTTEVVHKRSIMLGSNPGRVLILKRNISGTPLRVYSRLYLVGRRLYSLIVSTLETGGVGEDVVKRFMDSFTLTSSADARDH
ncbi:MAG: hypothetical protein JST00_21270 [Deltaproteobacteria bacterium]|nr:hypothetical protein [Deltaproteobacteria bacterium]